MAYRNLTIRAGLVAVQVAINPRFYDSTRPRSTRSCPDDGAPLKQHYLCPDCGGDHTADAVALYDGHEVQLPNPAPKSDVIDVKAFVPAIALGAAERSYDVSEGRGSGEAFGALHAAMVASQRVAVGEATLDKAPVQVAIEATATGMVLHVLRYADAYRDNPTPTLTEPSDAALGQATALVSSMLAEDVPPLADAYGAALREAIPTAEPLPTVDVSKVDDVQTGLLADIGRAGQGTKQGKQGTKQGKKGRAKAKA